MRLSDIFGIIISADGIMLTLAKFCCKYLEDENGDMNGHLSDMDKA